MTYTHKILQLKEQLNACILGQEKLIDMVLIGVFAQGHILLESVPGLAKTTLAKTLAKSLQLNFKRIQFTPDLLPSDILGAQVYNPKENDLVQYLLISCLQMRLIEHPQKSNLPS